MKVAMREGSERTSINLDVKLRERVREVAARERRTMSAQIEVMLLDALERRERTVAPIDYSEAAIL